MLTLTSAQRTLQLLVEEGLHACGIPPDLSQKVETRNDVREWDYGRYEGITSKTIREERAHDGLIKWVSSTMSSTSHLGLH